MNITENTLVFKLGVNNNFSDLEKIAIFGISGQTLGIKLFNSPQKPPPASNMAIVGLLELD